MSSDPILVWPDTPVSDVADLVDRSGISGVPVVDRSGYLVGVVTRMDLGDHGGPGRVRWPAAVGGSA